MNQLLLTCEHGGNQIPNRYSKLFKPFKKMLRSHKGFDEFALPIAKGLSKNLKVPLIYSETSRLLIDLNRSLDHQSLFSQVTQRLSNESKEQIIAQTYEPYRSKVRKLIQSAANRRNRRVVHLSIHSFTPVLGKKVRTCEIGLLFDPNRPFETSLAHALRSLLKSAFPEARIKMNYPYRGTSDGHTTLMRKIMPDRNYAGIEIEMNQKWLKPRTIKAELNETTGAIAAAIAQALVICQSHTDKKA
jgi:predicted N-formylglutamate amidohydrolase